MSADFRPVPAIPTVPADTPVSLRPILTALRDGAQVRFGQSRNKMDRNVTVRELVDLGLLTSQSAGARVALGTAISDAIKESTGQPTQGVLENISRVNFSVNTMGVIIDWAFVTGVNYDAIAYAEIWRSNAFVPLIDDSYPALTISAIGVDPPTLSWVNPAEAAAALDKNGNPLPAPTVALSGIASGFIYSEYITPGTHYFYWVRYRGYNDSYSGWHALGGTRVDAVPDWQSILDALEGELELVHLSTTLFDKITSIDDLEDGLLAETINRANALADEATARANAIAAEATARADAITAETTARGTAITAEANARIAAIADEATVRENRVLDAFAHTNARELVINGYVDSRAALQDTAIEEYAEIFTTADEALALQVNSMIAASGVWYVQGPEPAINPYWDGTYHWIETDNGNKHWVSTDATTSRPAITDVLPLPATIDATGWVDNEDGTYTKDDTSSYSNIRFEDVPAGTYTICYDCVHVTPGVGTMNFQIAGVGVVSGSGQNKNGTYQSTFTLGSTSDVFIAATSTVRATVGKVSLRAFTQMLGTPTLTNITDSGGGVYTKAVTVSAGSLQWDSIPAGTYTFYFTNTQTITGSIWLDSIVSGVTTRRLTTTSQGLSSVTFTLSDVGSVKLTTQAAVEGIFSLIGMRPSAEVMRWLDVTDTRIASTLAALTTEISTRNTQYGAQATINNNLTAQINAPVTGLLARANAMDTFQAYVLDQGVDGFLSEATKFTTLESTAGETATAAATTATALQTLTTYLNNTSSTGYIQQSLFGTSLGTSLANSLTGVLATNAALNALETYVNNQGADGLLLSSSQFTTLKTAVDNPTTGLVATANALTGLETFINDQGVDGFLASASRFTTLESQYDTLTGYIDSAINEEASARNTQFGPVASLVTSLDAQVNAAATGLMARATALESHKTYVLDQGESGYLAGASRFTALSTLASNTATSLATESDLRSSQYSSQVVINNTISGQINNPTTGLLARAAALESFRSYVLDEGVDGFLAESEKIIALESTANNASAVAGSASTAVQNLTTYLNNTGPTGYIQQALFATSLGTALANSMTGVLATNSALNTLESYINDQGPAGFLANASRITTLTTNTTTAQNTATQAVNAVDGLTTYINNQGVGGFLQSATRFTSLESSYAALEDDYAISSSVLQTLDSFVRDTGPAGFIATSSTLTTLIANAVSTRATVTQMNSAISTANEATAALVTQLEAKLQDPEQSVIYQEAVELVASVEGKLEGRVTNKLDVNGRITGFEFWDSLNDQYTSSSSFIISANTFQIRNPVTGSIPLSISGSAINLDFDVMTLSGVIPNANIGTVDVGKITGNTANFVNANIGNGTITSAKIADSIQSVNWNLFAGTGWLIGKDGTLFLNNLNARGNIEATSLKVDVANIVKTLHLQGNAVTVPGAQLYTNSVTYVNGLPSANNNTWHNILSLTMPNAGEVIPYNINIALKGYAFIKGSSAAGQVEIRIRIDSIVKSTKVIRRLWGGNTSTTPQAGDVTWGSVFAGSEREEVFSVETPSAYQAGGSVFAVDIRIVADNTDATLSYLKLDERGISIMGVKR